MKRILKALEKELKSLDDSLKAKDELLSRFFKSEKEYKAKIDELKDVIKLANKELWDVKNMYDELLKEMNNEKEN